MALNLRCKFASDSSLLRIIADRTPSQQLSTFSVALSIASCNEVAICNEMQVAYRPNFYHVANGLDTTHASPIQFKQGDIRNCCSVELYIATSLPTVSTIHTLRIRGGPTSPSPRACLCSRGGPIREPVARMAQQGQHDCGDAPHTHVRQKR